MERVKEIVSFAVDDNKGRKIDDLDAPDRFHSEFRVFDDFDLANAILSQACGRAADRAEIKAAMSAAGGAHFLPAIAFGKCDKAAACRHEAVDIAVHAARRRWTERARGISRRRLRRAGIVDR